MADSRYSHFHTPYWGDMEGRNRRKEDIRWAKMTSAGRKTTGGGKNWEKNDNDKNERVETIGRDVDNKRNLQYGGHRSPVFPVSKYHIIDDNVRIWSVL